MISVMNSEYNKLVSRFDNWQGRSLVQLEYVWMAIKTSSQVPECIYVMKNENKQS